MLEARDLPSQSAADRMLAGSPSRCVSIGILSTPERLRRRLIFTGILLAGLGDLVTGRLQANDHVAGRLRQMSDDAPHHPGDIARVRYAGGARAEGVQRLTGLAEPPRDRIQNRQFCVGATRHQSLPTVRRSCAGMSRSSKISSTPMARRTCSKSLASITVQG